MDIGSRYCCRTLSITNTAIYIAENVHLEFSEPIKLVSVNDKDPICESDLSILVDTNEVDFDIRVKLMGHLKIRACGKDFPELNYEKCRWIGRYAHGTSIVKRAISNDSVTYDNFKSSIDSELQLY